MTSAHHKQQMHRPSRAGDNARGARSIYAPAANDDAQDWPVRRAGIFVGMASIRRFALTSFDLLQLGRGLRGSGPFQFPNPTVGVSSPLTRAGRGLSADPLRRALPAFQFKTTNYVRQDMSNRSPATAHSLCLLRCNNHAAEGVVNVRLPVGGFRIV